MAARHLRGPFKLWPDLKPKPKLRRRLAALRDAPDEDDGDDDVDDGGGGPGDAPGRARPRRAGGRAPGRRLVADPLPLADGVVGDAGGGDDGGLGDGKDDDDRPDGSDFEDPAEDRKALTHSDTV